MKERQGISKEGYHVCYTNIPYKIEELTSALIEVKAENAKLSIIAYLTQVMEGKIKP